MMKLISTIGKNNLKKNRKKEEKNKLDVLIGFGLYYSFP